MKNQNEENNLNQENAEKIDFGTPLITWNSPEFLEHKRGALWIGAISVIAIALVIYGILTDSLLFSVVILLFAIVFFLKHNDKPKILENIITDLGIKHGDKFYPFEEIRTFWIIFDPPHVKTLNLRVTRGIVKEISIQLANQSPAEIRAFLSTEIPEWKNRTESLSEVLIRILKL